MVSIGNKVKLYKSTNICISTIVVFVGGMLLLNSEIHTEYRILTFLGLFALLFIVNAYFHSKIHSLRCPNCNKPIMTKTGNLDQKNVFMSAYSKCYFCGYEY